MPSQNFPRKNSNTETARDLMMGTIPEIVQKQEINPPQIQQTYQEIPRNREDPMSAPQWPVHQTINSGQSYNGKFLIIINIYIILVLFRKREENYNELVFGIGFYYFGFYLK